MPLIETHDMGPADEQFVGTCSHVNESDEIDATARRRLDWLGRMREKGLRVKVASINGTRVGFVYVMPIEISPWGPLGRELMVIPCLYVLPDMQHQGVGRALISEAEEEARWQSRKGICTIGYVHDFWFMPAAFFEKLGFKEVSRKGTAAIMWKTYELDAEPPSFLLPNYVYRPEYRKVVVDLFWHSFCGTSNTEAQRVREVVEEFGDQVVLHEYSADRRETFYTNQIPRGIFINGKEIGWGYEAPKDGIREAIKQELDRG